MNREHTKIFWHIHSICEQFWQKWISLFYRISIRAGNHFNDLTEVELVELKTEPSGWIIVPLKDIHEQPIRTFMLQIAVLSNYQNGRDTHMRQIKVHSPVQDITVAKRYNFTSVDMAQFNVIRWKKT